MEDKIKIELKKKPTSAFKIGDTTIKIIPWLESKYIAFVIGETLKTFKKSIEAGDNDETTLTVSLLTMEMLLAEVATNLDITDLSADDIGATGLFNAIHEKLLNYDTIKSAVLAVLLTLAPDTFYLTFFKVQYILLLVFFSLYQLLSEKLYM